MISNKYKKMQSKFQLPYFAELKETFNLEIDDNKEIFNDIRNEISEKIFAFTERIIEPLLYGSDSMTSILEAEMITEHERKKIFNLYKKIQHLKWRNNMLIIKPDEEEIAKWIKDIWNLWKNELEAELTNICKKLSISWKELKIENKKTNYYS